MQDILNVFRLRRRRRFDASTRRLAELVLETSPFVKIDTFIAPFQTPAFLEQELPEKRKQVSVALFSHIQKAETPCFLLPGLLQLIKQFSFYHFSHFEQWLNLESGLTEQQEMEIRAKIMGKFMPRDDYQIYFPIGCNRYYWGAHFVTAHPNPDLDTFVASFWGFADAFAAKVSKGLHIWNVPAAFSQVQPLANLLEDILGKGFVPTVAQSRPHLELVAEDVVEELAKGDEESISGLTHVEQVLEKEQNRFKIDNTRYAFTSKSLSKSYLGSVSLRDFGNDTEMSFSKSIQIISVIDHHKIALKTTEAPLIQVADVQSCNVLLAEMAFQLNDRIRSYKQAGQPYFVDSKREMGEYISFLLAICDDTDFLSKVTSRDVDCVKNLLNRLQSLLNDNSAVALTFDDIKRDEAFVNNAKKRLLESDDFIAIMEKIYKAKGFDLEQQMNEAVDGNGALLFSDTKTQNGVCKVGQIKLFSWNRPSFKLKTEQLLRMWQERAIRDAREHPQHSLYLQMISTVKTIKDQELTGNDAFWLWSPEGTKHSNALQFFLKKFIQAIDFKEIDLKILLINGAECPIYEIPTEVVVESNDIQPMVILTFKAGSLNSRKAKVTPFLPWK
ncbi:MAG: hypothetical protein JHC93_04860 [Parachlamydiales bacterium]|nr:hypothetical protein [Parachlamydiales bacterium]